ncbi:helix-turn-helix transcriptional regulator [Microbacterium sp. ASV49]|uniref:LuxR C-terminal-related transcriptional regulator n=1 Tax=Microbacterium candidum TaxID=3041922 RepID=A0ABT7MWI5_9MICO|nr:helix-turn-helix transcriptional regulator [Microbacterium sp. ASV49]MDL9978818.1 LuxR C-terminal-related transcriptional regulator [Microbacterium sp. ASV49]
MGNGLTAERVRGDVDVLSRAGLDLDEFLGEMTETMHRAVPWEGICIGTLDPASLLLTSGRKYGALARMDTEDALFAVLEYTMQEPSSFRALAQTELTAIGMHETMPAQVDRSERMNTLIRPIFGFGDEARVLFRDDVGTWGAMAIMRDEDAPKFSAEDVEFLASLSDSLARGVRGGILARLSESDGADAGTRGPAVIIVDREGEVTQISVGAEERLAQFHSSPNVIDPMGVVFALVAAARRHASAPGTMMPRTRVRTASGQWLVIHAAPLASRGGVTGDVVVTIEEARPPEIVELVVAAFRLTARERDVTRLVLQGFETKEIAASLFVSAYTVQDHLKSIFDKAGVRSRRELVARVYFDQYVPRMGTAVGPSGGFLA